MAEAAVSPNAFVRRDKPTLARLVEAAEPGSPFPGKHVEARAGARETGHPWYREGLPFGPSLRRVWRSRGSCFGHQADNPV